MILDYKIFTLIRIPNSPMFKLIKVQKFEKVLYSYFGFSVSVTKNKAE